MILPLVLSLFATTNMPRPASIEGVARQICLDFATGRYGAMTHYFNDELRAVATPAALESQHETLAAQIGAFQFITTVKRHSENGLPVVDVTAKFEKSFAIMNVYFDDDLRVSSVHMSPAPEHPADPLENEARQFLDDFNARRFDAIVSRFDARMRQTLPVPKLEELSKQIAQTYGTFTAVKKSRIAKSPELFTVELIADYSGTPVAVNVVFNRAHRIAGIRFAPASKKAV